MATMDEYAKQPMDQRLQRLERTADELAVLFGGLLQVAGLSFSNQITGVVLSSVVPSSTGALRDMVNRYFNFPPVVVEPGTRTGLSIQTDNPREVGADRIVNALAAFHRYGGPCIVIDFGTATTYDVVSDKGEFLGGAISPGVQTSNASLSRETARLPQVELNAPRSPIGRNTIEAIQSGLIFGTAAEADGMIERIRKERVGEDELRRAKNYLLGRYEMDRRTNERQAWYLGFYTVEGVGREYPDRYRRAVEAVTAADVQRTAQTYLTTLTSVVLQPPPTR
jgi:type III pantothenate kinase